MNNPLRALDAGLDALRNRADHGDTEPLFGPDGGDANSATLCPGVTLRLDPAARASGHWSSPAGRLIELHTTLTTPGAWFGLHIGLPPDLPPLDQITWIGIVARSNAVRALGVRVCLRSGLPGGGFQDSFFPHHILSQGRLSDHHDLLAPAHLPDLPRTAPWRELVLFLPPAEGIDWALHDLRIFAL